MKIAFFDNLANNAYNLTKILRKSGYEADLILDFSDLYPMSQPIWEDCNFTISANSISSEKLTHAFWIEKRKELKWNQPQWIKEAIHESKLKGLFQILKNPYKYCHLIKRVIKHRSLFPCCCESITENMRQYDVIVGFGLGPIYAFWANVPFIHYPYGGDLTLVPFSNNTIGHLQRNALKHAQYIIFGDPGYLEFMQRLGIDSKAIFLPFIIDTETYKPLSKSEIWGSLDVDIGQRIQDRFIFFVPSRQDFHWKGSDKILAAFSKLAKRRKDVFLILSGWGNDLDKSIEMAQHMNINEQTFFLPCILSKKRLVMYYNLADVIIDQFTLGAYGTSTMEAMACAKPVIMDFDMERYRPFFKILPPVLRAKSEGEIYSQMEKVSEQNGLCEQIGKDSREWIMEYHSVKSNLDKFIKLCQQCLRTVK